MPQMRQVEAAQIAQFDPFELRPQPLPRVQFRGIGRQALRVNPLSRTIHQERFDTMAAVYGGAIPDDDQAARDLPQQVLQERDHIRRVESAVLTMEIQLPLRGDGTDGREMVAGVPLAQDGRLAPWGIGVHDTGQGIKPGFVYEEDGLLLGFRPLLMAGQVSSRQRVIAASSRWRARRMGLCGLQRIALQRRPTWVGW
jgi:hypothetical protein